MAISSPTFPSEAVFLKEDYRFGVQAYDRDGNLSLAAYRVLPAGGARGNGEVWHRRLSPLGASSVG